MAHAHTHWKLLISCTRRVFFFKEIVPEKSLLEFYFFFLLSTKFHFFSRNPKVFIILPGQIFKNKSNVLNPKYRVPWPKSYWKNIRFFRFFRRTNCENFNSFSFFSAHRQESQWLLRHKPKRQEERKNRLSLGKISLSLSEQGAQWFVHRTFLNSAKIELDPPRCARNFTSVSTQKWSCFRKINVGMKIDTGRMKVCLFVKCKIV